VKYEIQAPTDGGEYTLTKIEKGDRTQTKHRKKEILDFLSANKELDFIKIYCRDQISKIIINVFQNFNIPLCDTSNQTLDENYILFDNINGGGLLRRSYTYILYLYTYSGENAKIYLIFIGHPVYRTIDQCIH